MIEVTRNLRSLVLEGVIARDTPPPHRGVVSPNTHLPPAGAAARATGSSA